MGHCSFYQDQLLSTAPSTDTIDGALFLSLMPTMEDYSFGYNQKWDTIPPTDTNDGYNSSH
ncbi:unnamed protein product [Staurois parvus]|uniref:Uncharacterized protein n=1 Tax=Staurois parvus TaxID=386267 RepID=A0ABN9CTF7_9NEOB|nr:unnamed protein product [Staurois parvus]